MKKVISNLKNERVEHFIILKFRKKKPQKNYIGVYRVVSVLGFEQF